MRSTKLFCTLTILFLLMAGVMAPHAHSVEFGAGAERGNCSDLKRQIASDWLDLKSFFRPDAKDLKRPKSKEFFCVSPYYTRGAMSKNSTSRDLKCYTVSGQNFCCDKKLSACAGVQ